MAHNVKRKGKNLWTDRAGGAQIGYYEAPDGENEALFVADYISKYLAPSQMPKHGETPRAAVLYRTNSQSRLVEEAMRRYQLKYHVVGGFSFYERAEIKDMISYLKVIENPDDSIALQRIINTPPRGIGKTTMETVERIALETNLSLWGAIQEVIGRELLPPRALAALKGFRQLIDDARAMYLGSFVEHLQETAAPASEEDEADFQHAIEFSPEMFTADEATEFDPAALSSPEDGARASNHSDEQAVEGFRAPGEAASTAELLKFLIDRTGYIKQLEAEDTPDALARIENLRELVNAAMDSRDRGETLNEFLDHAALVSDADEYDENSRITLMTLHAAKGLEFPLVFLVGLEEGLFPHSRTLLAPDDIEEERRLCYVGMTRAMDTLILTRARYRRRYGTDMPEASVPSRFLEEVPQELLQELGTARRSTSRTGGEGSGPSHYCVRGRGPAPAVRKATREASQLLRRADLQLHRQHRGVFRLARQEVFAAKVRCRPKPADAQDSAPGSASVIPSTVKDWCINARETGKTPRLRYNFLSSA